MPNGISVLARRPVLNKGEVSTKAAMASAVLGDCVLRCLYWDPFVQLWWAAASTS